jgi:hypothetical protein
MISGASASWPYLRTKANTKLSKIRCFAKAAGYTDYGPEGYRLLKKRQIREEIERLQARVAKTGNAIMAKALADSVPDGQDQPKIDAKLAKSLADRRGAESSSLVSVGRHTNG